MEGQRGTRAMAQGVRLFLCVGQMPIFYNELLRATKRRYGVQGYRAPGQEPCRGELPGAKTRGWWRGSPQAVTPSCDLRRPRRLQIADGRRKSQRGRRSIAVLRSHRNIDRNG